MKMHFLRILAILGFLITAALSVAVQKQVVVTYPDDTPDSVLDKAKEAIVEAV
jgi:hypothetical protein